MAVSIVDSVLLHGAKEPITDTVNHTTMLGYDTDLASYVVAKFQRQLDSGDLQDSILFEGMNFTFSYTSTQALPSKLWLEGWIMD